MKTIFSASRPRGKHLIPSPRHIQWGEHDVKISDYQLLPWPGAPDLAERYAAFFPARGGARRVLLETVDVLGREGYAITIQPEQIVIRAGAERGFFYAYQTLCQLRDGDLLSCVTIEDEPALAMRGFQLPFHSMRQMTAADGERLIRTAAKFKLNTILVEYDDRFPFQRHPAISSGNALSLEQVRRLAELARENHIDLIPLMQSFGHLGFVLENAPYDQLREGNRPEYRYRQQICPTHPGSLPLFIELAGEIMAEHQSRFFHIGADEVRNLGECPRCAKAVSGIGQEGLFIRHITRICEWVKKQGRTPILWDDMLSRFPAVLEPLDRETVIMYWDYWTTSERSPIVVARGSGKGVVYDARWKKEWAAELTDLERVVTGKFAGPCDLERELSAEYLALFRSYLGPEFPKYMTPFPNLRFFKERGFQVIGAPTTLGNTVDETFGLPNYARFLGNIRQFSRRCIEENALGLVTTAWYDFPVEILDLGLMATAQFAWHGGE